LKAAIACHRDADWNRLYQAINTSQASECVHDLIKTTRQFETLEIDASVDPQFCRFLSLHLRWNAVLDMIKQFNPLTSGELMDNERHVVLFVPNAVMDYFVLMETTPDDQKLKVYACSKHKRRFPNQLDTVEKLFMGNLATTLGYHLWKCTK
jgi:hypothetical protein